VSPYAATKLAAEELGHVYTGLYGIQFIALRLFTVYGPRQRPDLALQQFYNRIKTGQPITVFGDGNTTRDYTSVSDIISGILAALHYDGKEDTIFNLGNSKQVSLRRMIRVLEDCMQMKALINWQDKQPGDVDQTSADISKAARLLGYQPKVDIEEGIRRFVQWKEQQEASVPWHDKNAALAAGLTPNNR
jgi:UDP-glucuronate 4-epimerase